MEEMWDLIEMYREAEDRRTASGRGHSGEAPALDSGGLDRADPRRLAAD